jgi:methionyl-tRNA formyltransferase
MALRLVFMGTPEFAVPTLLEIVGRGHEIAAVYTRAPKPAGRGMDLMPSPVEREASRFGLTVRTPKTLRNAEAADEFRQLGAEAAVVVAYGLILPAPILAGVPLGCFNLHASLLPRWRGAAPIHRAVMAGDTESGVMVMRMDEGLDTGPVAMAERVPIGPDMTTGDLHDRLAPLGADLMVRALSALERDTLSLTPQAETGVTYATKIEKSETRVDWSKPWRQVHDHCRGLSPFPGASFEIGAGAPLRIKILRTARGEGSGMPGTVLDDALTIACGEGAVRIVELQRAGGKPMRAEVFLRGAPVPVGSAVSRH